MSKKRKYIPVDWDSVDDLGTVKDSIIAERLKVSSQAVQQARARRRIDSSSTVGRPRLSPNKRKELEAEKRRKFKRMAKIGGWDWTYTDREMSEKYQVKTTQGKTHKHAAFFNRIRIMLDIPAASVLRNKYVVYTIKEKIRRK